MTSFEALCTFAEQKMAEHNLPGMAIGILKDGQFYTAGLGITSVDNPLDVHHDTLFQIGSISKTMTGTVAMRLIEQGKLDLDSKVQDYIPDFKVQDPEASANATIRNLLTHTGGWVGDYFHDTGRGDDNLQRYVTDMASLPQLAPYNKFFSYSNSSFALLGRVIEIVTGEVFEDVMQRMLFDPLGMTSATYEPTVAMTNRFAVGHKTHNSLVEVKRPYAMPRAVNPMGGVICNVEDMLRYARFYIKEGKTEHGKRLLKKKTINNMQKSQVNIRAGFDVGLSWILGTFAGEALVWHNGGTVGQLAQLTLLIEHNFAFAAVTNSDKGSNVYSAVQQEAFKLFLDLQPEQPQSLHIENPEDDDLQQYIGLYSRPFSELEIGLIGNQLVGIMTQKQGFPNEDTPIDPPQPPMRIEISDSNLKIKDGLWKGVVIDVLRHDDGSIGWIRFGSRLLKKLT